MNTGMRWVRSRNGGPTKLAEWVPEADAWRVQGRPELIDRERFAGNYEFVDDRKVKSG
jgi:hypothetical protein